MTLVALILFAALGAGAAARGLPRAGLGGRVGMAAGALTLVLVMALAFALETAPITDSGFPSGELLRGHLVPTAYLRIVVGLWALESVVLVFIGWLLGGTRTLRGLLPATLAAIAGGSAALASANLGLSVAMATVTGLAALVVVLAVEGPGAVAAAALELRVTLLTGSLLLAAVEIVPLVAQVLVLSLGGGTQEGSAPGAPTTGGEAGAVIGLLALAGGAAIAMRYGVLPFHLRVPRLADVVPPISLPLLLVWIPLPLAVAAIAAVDLLVTPLGLALDGERAVIVFLAVLTLVGAALAAFTQDDLRHATGYLVIADAGILVLAMAALDPAAWGPTRTWVVVMAASKTALGAWSAVVEERFGTRSIPDLRGWMRRSPLLAAGLIVTTLATFGLPGWVAFAARDTLASLAVDGAAATLLVLAGFLTLPTYIRLLVLGGGTVTSRVDGAAPERFGRSRRAPKPGKAELLPVEVEHEQPGGATAGAAAAAPSETAASARLRTTGVTTAAPFSARLAAALHRDRAELLSGAVLALALLAALTSWGALDIGGAAAEPAPVVAGPIAD